MSFEKNVFINCPFDKSYYRLLRPLLFTVIYLGFKPRISLESIDSGSTRIDKLRQLIHESKFAIHDISRMEAKSVGELSRLNMPFELGMDIGCRYYAGGQLAAKRCLIFDTKPYRYQAALSDISGQDIASHNNCTEKIVEECRKWLNNQCGLSAVGPSFIWSAFTDFVSENYDELILTHSKADIRKLPIPELIGHMEKWVGRRVTSATKVS